METFGRAKWHGQESQETVPQPLVSEMNGPFRADTDRGVVSQA